MLNDYKWEEKNIFPWGGSIFKAFSLSASNSPEDIAWEGSSASQMNAKSIQPSVRMNLKSWECKRFGKMLKQSTW